MRPVLPSEGMNLVGEPPVRSQHVQESYVQQILGGILPPEGPEEIIHHNLTTTSP